MGYEKVEILVTSWRWNPEIPEEEQNFFSPEFVTKQSDEVNLLSVMELSPLTVKRTFDNVERENGKFTLFYETEEIRFKFINFKYLEGEPLLVSNSRITDLFRCFDNTQRFKWIVKIKYDGLPKWIGVIRPENVSYNNEDATVSVSAYGIESEFAEYYTNKTLEETFSVIYTNGDAPYQYFNPVTHQTDLKYLQSSSLTNVLNDNFNTVSATIGDPVFEYQIDSSLVGDWYVNEYPVFINNGTIKSVNYPFLLLKGGYRKLFEEGVSRLQWLGRTCRAMGWQFFFQYIGDKLTLFVVPRSRNNLTYVQQLDYKDINPDWSCGKRGVKEKFDYIEIPCGALTGGDDMFFGGNLSSETNPNDLKGNHISLISDKVRFVNKSIHFDSLDGGGHPQANPGYAFLKYNGEDDKTYKAIAWTCDTVNYINSTPTYYEIPKDNILRIDSGLNAQKYIKIAGFGVHYDQEDGNSVGENDLVVKGCYGDLLYKSDDHSTHFTYQDYVLTDEFRLNHVPYLATNKELSVKFNIKGIYDNPYTTLQVQNTSGEGSQAFSGRYFATSEIETDYFEDKTSYEVFQTKI